MYIILYSITAISMHAVSWPSQYSQDPQVPNNICKCHIWFKNTNDINFILRIFLKQVQLSFHYCTQAMELSSPLILQLPCKWFYILVIFMLQQTWPSPINYWCNWLQHTASFVHLNLRHIIGREPAAPTFGIIWHCIVTFIHFVFF